MTIAAVPTVVGFIFGCWTTDSRLRRLQCRGIHLVLETQPFLSQKGSKWIFFCHCERVHNYRFSISATCKRGGLQRPEFPGQLEKNSIILQAVLDLTTAMQPQISVAKQDSSQVRFVFAPFYDRSLPQLRIEEEGVGWPAVVHGVTKS